MRIWEITDIGLVRKENQDAYLTRQDTETPSGHMICVVCDGMGGPTGGQIASETAVNAYMAALETRLSSGMSPQQLLDASAQAVSLANQEIRAKAARNAIYGHMGTTLVSAISHADGMAITNVGDSRAYYITESGIEQRTRDHSLVQSMVDRGDITAEEARRHPKRNLITRALGPEENVQCDGYIWPMEPNSCLLLCTDGLLETMTEQEMFEEIRRMMRGQESGDHCLENLVSKARNEGGAPDNITVVLIQKA